MMQFKTSNTDGKTRLDKYLAEQMPAMTRSQIKKLIENGLILVNDEKPSVHQFLKEGDTVVVKESEIADRQPVPDITILGKGGGWIAIDKPAGLIVHRAKPDSPEPAVTDWLIENYPDIKTVGDPIRPGIVHRLDRDTSGVMVIATTQEYFDHLKRQFHDRLIEKTYTALVHEHLPELKGTIDKPIGRSKKGARMAARVESISDKDREAITDYEVEKSYQKFDLVKARPRTGRTHQIRVHFMSMGTPVVGDKIYTVHGQKEVIDLGRVFLHSSELSFTDLDGTKHTIKSPLPNQLSNYLQSLK